MGLKNSKQYSLHRLPSMGGQYLKSTVQLVSELAKNNQVVLYTAGVSVHLEGCHHGQLGKARDPRRRILGKEQRLRKLQLDNGAEVNVLTLPPMLPVKLMISGELLYGLAHGGQCPESLPGHPNRNLPSTNWASAAKWS